MTASNRPIALVTGASSGIGADLARELARDGHDLILSARRIEPMQKLAEELKALGAGVTVITADLSKAGAAAALVHDIEARGLAVDTLINNAGLGDNSLFHLEDRARIDEMLQVNIVALTELTRLLLPGMVSRRRGRVMLVASTASFQPGPYMAVYCATKAYVLSLGEAIGYELRGTGVTLSVLCPGGTDTEFAKVANSTEMKLHKNPMMPRMAAAEVARQGYAALKTGRAVLVTGWFNKTGAFLNRITPRSTATALAGSLLKRA
jgi:short-subunit dehydrogenase